MPGSGPRHRDSRAVPVLVDGVDVTPRAAKERALLRCWFSTVVACQRRPSIEELWPDLLSGLGHVAGPNRRITKVAQRRECRSDCGFEPGYGSMSPDVDCDRPAPVARPEITAPR
jgi:hypothetical protein